MDQALDVAKRVLEAQLAYSVEIHSRKGPWVVKITDRLLNLKCFRGLCKIADELMLDLVLDNDNLRLETEA